MPGEQGFAAKSHSLRSRVRRFESCRGRSQLRRPEQGFCPGHGLAGQDPCTAMLGSVVPCSVLPVGQ